MGTEFLGTVCPGGLFVQGDQSIGTNCGGPNVREPYAFGTKYVKASKVIFVKTSSAEHTKDI